MTRTLARKLRNNATLPECKAWELLRGLRVEGIAVRRQHPIGRYIADFAIMRERLAIEIDGPLHEKEENKLADIERDKAFAHLGWRVLRFTSKQADDSNAFITAIRAALTPSPRGEGAGGRVNHQPPDNAAAPAAIANSTTEDHPTPQPPPLAGRGSFAPHLQRRTRANRRLPSRAKP